MFDLEAYRRQNPFFLAPMAGVTDRPFRSFMREMGCGIITSELVSARALKDNSQKTLRLMEFEEAQRPYGIQIFGEDPFLIGEGAKKAEGFGADFIDLNLGCPVSKIVKKGAGSALLKDLTKLSKILRALKASVEIPVSLKVRSGWDDQSLNAEQVSRIAFEEGFSWMAIHGRTRAQAYSGQSDWNYIKKVKSQSQIPIVGNGDLTSGAMAFEALRFSLCDGVMIGRGCLSDPWIFLTANRLFKKEMAKKGAEGSAPSASAGELFGKGSSQKANNLPARFLREKQREQQREKRSRPARGSPQTEPALNGFKLAIDRLTFHLENFYEEQMLLLQLKKFSAWLSSGFPHSTEFRKSLFQEKDKRALMKKIEEFFSNAEGFAKPPPAYEPFLMRGHG